MTKKYTFQEAIYFYYIVMRSSLLHRSGSDLFMFYCQEELYITRVEVIYLYYSVPDWKWSICIICKYCLEELSMYCTRVEVIYLYYIVGVVHEIFLIWSFPQTAPPGPIWDLLGPFFLPELLNFQNDSLVFLG